MFNSRFLNGAPLNGRLYNRLVTAAAVLVATSAVAADGTRAQLAQTSAEAVATVAATTHKRTFGYADLLGTADFAQVPSQTHQAAADIAAVAETYVYALGFVDARAEAEAEATVSARPGASQGRASGTCVAEAAADAQRAYRAVAAAVGTATAANLLEGKVFRYMQAVPAGVATVLSDAGVNGVYTGVAHLEAFGGLDIQADAVVLKRVDMLIEGTATMSALGGIATHGRADLASSALAEVTAVRVARVNAAAEAVAEGAGVATRVQFGRPDAVCTADVIGAVVQRHAGAVAAGATAEASVQGTRGQLALATMDCVAVVDPPPSAAYRYGSVTAQGLAEVSALPTTNAAAMDPPERTMYRVAVDRTMVRPFVDRVMYAPPAGR